MNLGGAYLIIIANLLICISIFYFLYLGVLCLVINKYLKNDKTHDFSFIDTAQLMLDFYSTKLPNIKYYDILKMKTINFILRVKYNPLQDRITIPRDYKKNDFTLFVVLHEMMHSIQYSTKCKESLITLKLANLYT